MPHPDHGLAPVSLAERWVELDGRRVFYRFRDDGEAAIVHVHGFAISGKYLLPTAEMLASNHRTYVPDLPGYGRSEKPSRALTIPQLADSLVRFLDAMQLERATLVGNSMGCSVISSVAHRHPSRVERAVLVSPAGGAHNQPLPRGVLQLLTDALREPPSMAAVAIPDYLRFGLINSLLLFKALVEYPALERFLEINVPSLAVIGSRDPLLPPRGRVEEVAQQCEDWLSVAVVRGAAHSVNYSHPHQLATLIHAFMGEQRLIDYQGDDIPVVRLSKHLTVTV